MPRRRHPLGPTALARQDRIEKALDLRIGGMPVSAIAATLGVDRTTVHRYITEGTAGRGERIEDKRQAEREIQSAQIDEVIASVLPLAKEGELGAVDRLVKLWSRQAQLLGLDLRAPDQVEQHLHVHANPVAADASSEIMQQLREWAVASSQPALPDVIEHQVVDGSEGADE
jgi:hypothetical protein